MNFPSWLRIITPALAGAIAGLSVAALAQSSARAPQRPSALSAGTVAPLVSVAPRVVVGAYDDRRIADLEKQVAALAASRAEASAPSDAPSPLEDRELRAQRVLEQHGKLLEKHDAERRDTAWAPRKEEAIGASLGKLSEAMKGSFSLGNVDCRTSSCVAQLTWPNEGAARADLKALLNGSVGVECAREIAFPPASGDGAYVAAMYVDCAEAPTAGTQKRE